MAYTPLNLQNGQVLTAEDLQHMEQGILANELPPPRKFPAVGNRWQRERWMGGSAGVQI